MRTTIAILAAMVMVLSGCSSMDKDSKKMTCDTAQQAYLAYQALIASGVVDVDPETVAYVKIAASFLGMYCGWTPETVVLTGAKGVERGTVFDANGVPILKQP